MLPWESEISQTGGIYSYTAEVQTIYLSNMNHFSLYFAEKNKFIKNSSDATEKNCDEFAVDNETDIKGEGSNEEKEEIAEQQDVSRQDEPT